MSDDGQLRTDLDEKIEPTVKHSRRDHLTEFRATLPEGDPAIAAIDRIMSGHGTQHDVIVARMTFMEDESPDLQELRAAAAL